ncbi:uncharacterized protein BDV14DRAFT_83800 [Aspergillus stella-maris]|uniref:uncharacterized protein n=1 Tax=Aspergillus stella-maris TaxID=1810926 RepID=UPI003CCD6DA9
MESGELTFLNITGAFLPGAASKRMRAHVTRANFAKRRQRLADGETETGQNAKKKQRKKRQKTTASVTESTESRSLVEFGTSSIDAAGFRDLQNLLFIEGSCRARTLSEATWFNLIISDPALTQATLAVAISQWSPDSSWQTKADEHSCIAVTLIKQRITSTIASQPDGVLGAVMTMAFGAALARDAIVWEVHAEGLAQIIKEREKKSPLGLPTWFLDLIVEDSINGVFGFPRGWHPSVTDALTGYHDHRIPELSEICRSVIRLRKVIASHHRQPLHDTMVATEIEEPLARLHYETRALRDTGTPHVDAAARAIEIALYVLWPSQTSAHLTLLAGQLKKAICRFPIRRCAYMDFTSYQLMIGAIAAGEGSPVRTWFVEKVTEAVRWTQNRGWVEPLSVLEWGLERGEDDDLAERFRALWREIQNGEAMPHAKGSIGCW